MAVKIRLQRHGRKQRPFYHIVVADARAPRDGRFIQKLGIYNPLTKPATIKLDVDLAYHWLTVGAQPTDTARAILKYKGVMYKKHLQRGVGKGALTQEEADSKLAEWIRNKEAAHDAKKEQTAKEKAEFLKMVSGEIKPRKAKEDNSAAEEFVQTEVPTDTPPEATEEAPAAVAEEAAVESPAAEVTEEATSEEASPAAEEVPAAVAEEAAVESPAAEVTEETTSEEASPAAEEAPAAVAEEAAIESPEAEVTEETTSEEVSPAAEEAPAAVAEEAASTSIEAESTAEIKADDLKKIEGIGPKISELLNAAGIVTFGQLADSSAESLKEILENAGGRMKMHNPTTWPKQAELAAAGKWDELKELQDRLDGGRE